MTGLRALIEPLIRPELCEAVLEVGNFKRELFARKTARVTEVIKPIRLIYGESSLIGEIIGYKVNVPGGEEYRWFIFRGWGLCRMSCGKLALCSRHAKGAVPHIILESIKSSGPAAFLRFDKQKQWYVRFSKE